MFTGISLNNSLHIVFNAKFDDIAEKLVEANNCGDIQPNFHIFSVSFSDF